MNLLEISKTSTVVGVEEEKFNDHVIDDLP